MKKIFKKSVAVLSLLLVILSMITTAYASSYSTTYQFGVSLTGITRSFNGTNIRFISPNATSSPFVSQTYYTYSVSLYRDKFIDDYIGSVNLYRDDYGVASWNNVGSGDYYVILNKENDGVTLTDNDVTIENY